MKWRRTKFATMRFAATLFAPVYTLEVLRGHERGWRRIVGSRPKNRRHISINLRRCKLSDLTGVWILRSHRILRLAGLNTLIL